jgi:hypothetical protein
MKILIIVVMLMSMVAMYACAQEEHAERYRFYTIKNGNNDLAILLDSATGKNWQVFVDSTGKVTHLAAVTVEGLAYAPKDNEQLYSKVQSANIDELSTSNAATKLELDKLYGYGLDTDKLVAIRDKVKAAVAIKR